MITLKKEGKNRNESIILYEVISDHEINEVGILSHLYDMEYDKVYDLKFPDDFKLNGCTTYFYEPKKTLKGYDLKDISPEMKIKIRKEDDEKAHQAMIDQDNHIKEVFKGLEKEREEIVKSIWKEKDLKKAASILEKYTTNYSRAYKMGAYTFW